MNILEIKNLVKSFPAARNFWGKVTENVKAVQDVSFAIKKGEVLGLVGESGCGKTTLGRLILKLIESDSGQIIFEGQDITHLSASQMRPLRKDIQIIFQDPYSSLNPRMTVARTLMEPLKIHRLCERHQRYDRAVELLKMVGLDESAMQKFPHEFSGGQRQRIGIARALAVEPKLIVADEAVSALDISIQAQIINLLIDLKEKLGLTLVFIAHDLKVVEHISDRICVMYLGRVMEMLPADQIANAKHPYTQSLLSAVPVPDPNRKSQRQILEGDVPSPINPPLGCVFHTRCPKAVPDCAKMVPSVHQVSEAHFHSCDVVG
ncbi:MAG: ATP-binding cassette domain-containing protein [Deltaproteobacteria bacterium]|nr:ATP-binding cassette domain-containing protein [Deltaproteobacteria bacterium]